MKILHIITSLKIGGAERALCTLLSSLSQKSDIQHHVAYFYDGPCHDTLRSLNIPTHHINGLFSLYDPFAYLRLKRLIHKLKPDILHTSLWSANILGRVIGFECKIPVISDLHGNCIHEGKFRNMLDQWTAHVPFRTVAVADEVKNAYQKHIINPMAYRYGRQQAAERLVVIKNGIDVESVRAQAAINPLPRTQLDIEHDAFVIGSVGRLEPIKSYDVLIRSFAQHLAAAPRVRKSVLLLVGGGSQIGSLKQLAQELGIAQNVIFAGPQADAYRFYPLFDCFALSSQSEGLSLALLEALCFNLPIITTNNGSRHEVITDSINGLLVPPNDYHAFCQALNALYGNAALINAMRTANQLLIQTSFHSNTTATHYEALFRLASKSSN